MTGGSENNKYVIYTSALAKTKITEQVNTHLVSVRLIEWCQVSMIYSILDIYGIVYEEVDVYVDGCLGGTKGKEMREKSGSKELPQIFINGQFLKGGLKEFKKRSEAGEL